MSFALASLGIGTKGQETTQRAGRDERAVSDSAQELPARRSGCRPFRDFT
jgi:hypothetical protein